MATSTANGHHVVDLFDATACPAEIAACSLALMRGNGIRLSRDAVGTMLQQMQSRFCFSSERELQPAWSAGSVTQRQRKKGAELLGSLRV
jgi:hypothetical protein